MALVEMDFMNGSGGAECTAVYCSAYVSGAYTFDVVYIDDLSYREFVDGYAGGGSLHTFRGITIQNTATHTYTFTATDGYRLYSADNAQLIDYGVNGTATVESYYNVKSSFIAIKGEITVQT